MAMVERDMLKEKLVEKDSITFNLRSAIDAKVNELAKCEDQRFRHIQQIAQMEIQDGECLRQLELIQDQARKTRRRSNFIAAGGLISGLLIAILVPK